MLRCGVDRKPHRGLMTPHTRSVSPVAVGSHTAWWLCVMAVEHRQTGLRPFHGVSGLYSCVDSPGRTHVLRPIRDPIMMRLCHSILTSIALIDPHLASLFSRRCVIRWVLSGGTVPRTLTPVHGTIHSLIDTMICPRPRIQPNTLYGSPTHTDRRCEGHTRSG